MKDSQLIILQKDMDLLSQHLQKAVLSDFNRKKLLLELHHARVVPLEKLPYDAVALNSFVEVLDLVSKQKFSFTLVAPAEANLKKNRISVFAPMGIALLGYLVGAEVQWEMPGGLKSFKILKVVQNAIEQQVE
ncbi:GreA/GreB family elongation factor [Desertivirga arenae]|uniref:GreA/GreB family elongation factor n=1 Tax=Desertivirga arenae TaxID=2810309 RepID=UPI001A970902|nr:GreA/GreB family elongation factor [Pedobacter sp. SYSU D00823]